MADVFISYKSERRPAARHLASIIEAHGFSVWFDYDLVPGKNFGVRIEAELRQARAVLVLWCSRSISSEWVQEEADLAKKLGTFVPARIEPCDPPLGFRRDDFVDIAGWDGDPSTRQLDRLIDRVESLVGREATIARRALVDLHTTWVTHGRPSLVQFAVEPGRTIDAAERRLPSAVGEPPQTAHRGAPGSTAATEAALAWPEVRDSRDIRRLQRFAERFAGTWFADEAAHLREAIESEERERVAAEAERAAAEARQRAEQEQIARKRAAEEERYRKEGRIQITVGNGMNDQIAWAKPGAGEPFRDIDLGPEMVVVPAGWFMMGEAGSQRQVAMEKPFAIGRFALTFDEWDAAQAHPEWQRHAGINARKASDHGWGRGKQPAIDVSWADAEAYCKWLSALTAKSYRLPTEAEWEYCCRAGTTTAYSTGDQITKKQAQFSEGSWGSAKQTVKVGSFPPNAWGLHDMHGNVWEWCEDKWDASSSSRVLRGGSWLNLPNGLRSADRDLGSPDFRNYIFGFRLARTL